MLVNTCSSHPVCSCSVGRTKTREGKICSDYSDKTPTEFSQGLNSTLLRLKCLMNIVGRSAAHTDADKYRGPFSDRQEIYSHFDKSITLSFKN